jgi:hypothetical protein
MMSAVVVRLAPLQVRTGVHQEQLDWDQGSMLTMMRGLSPSLLPAACCVPHKYDLLLDTPPACL